MRIPVTKRRLRLTPKYIHTISTEGQWPVTAGFGTDANGTENPTGTALPSGTTALCQWAGLPGSFMQLRPSGRPQRNFITTIEQVSERRLAAFIPKGKWDSLVLCCN